MILKKNANIFAYVYGFNNNIKKECKFENTTLNTCLIVRYDT